MSDCENPVNSKCAIGVTLDGERENSWIFITRDDLKVAQSTDASTDQTTTAETSLGTPENLSD